MVERARRRKRRRKILGNHQRCWIWGRHVVRETLRAGRWPIIELWIADRLPADELEEARALALEHGYSVTTATAEELVGKCGSHEHQGYAARMPAFPYRAPQELLDARPRCPLFVVLDRVQDPFNFGAILRCADALGVDGVFVEATGQAAVSSQVARSSAGALNHLAIAEAPALEPLLLELKNAGLAVVAADGTAERELFHCDLRRPSAIVIGNEGAGIRPELRALCTECVRIPLHGHVESLNAAVSAGILLYEANRQRSR